MIDFSANFENDVLTYAYFRYRKIFWACGVSFGEKWETFFGHVGLVLKKNGKMCLL